jgi:hypothetical protein
MECVGGMSVCLTERDRKRGPAREQMRIGSIPRPRTRPPSARRNAEHYRHLGSGHLTDMFIQPLTLGWHGPRADATVAYGMVA